MDLDSLFLGKKPAVAKVIAVAAAEDDVVLRAVATGYEKGLCKPILCGDATKIIALASQMELDISAFPIEHVSSSADAARKAVSLVRTGKADVLMKGLMHTSELLRAVLDKENGIRGGGIISHVAVIQSPILGRTLLFTDAAMVTYPDLKTKAEIIKNAVSVAHKLGIACPKVAVLAAVEVVNPDMQSTLDAAALTVMNQRGQIKGCIVDGPMAMDLALSPEAVKHKGMVSDVAGAADIFVFHNIEAANNTAKALIYAGNCLFGGVIIGAKAPIVMPSRADSDQAKLFSIACAINLVE